MFGVSHISGFDERNASAIRRETNGEIMTDIEFKELNTCDAEWERDADRLARLKTPFVLVGFNYELDVEFCHALEKRYNLSATLDPNSSRAYFKPKSAN